MNVNRFYLAAVILTGLLNGCSSESVQPSDAVAPSLTGSGSSASHNHPPVIHSARILPNVVTLSQKMSVQAKAFDPDGDIVTFRHQWSVNGRPLSGETRALLDSGILQRGDRVSVDVVPYDGKIEGIVMKAEVVMANAPPVVTQLTVEPAEARVGDRIEVHVVGVDADQDPIEYRFRWWRNNSEVADGSLSELDTSGFSKGDTIIVEATPSDPASKGKSKLSTPVALSNSPPMITSGPPSTIEGNQYVYAVTAIDPDGDPLVYALESSPPGMKIDKKTGRIEWPLSGKVSGSHKIRVTATDPDQARAFQEFAVTVAIPAGSSRQSFSKHVRFRARLVSPFPALLE